VVSAGHDTVMVHDGRVTDQLVAYHEARAAGGAGLIVVQVAGVHPTAKYTSHVLMADTDDCIPGYRRLAEAGHAHGCAVFGQLFHGGREIMESEDGSLPVALAPSAVPTERFHVIPRAMPVPLVQEVVAGFGTAAGRLERAGLDGAELIASHGYLLAQFLNPRVNLRDDEYGGSEENRLRFVRECIAAVRAATSPDFVLGLRISVDEIGVDGLAVDETLSALARLDAAGGLDYLSVVAGSSATLAGSVHIVPPMSEPAAYTAPLAARVKAVVGVPVMVAGRINQPHEAEQVIASGQADACGMVRAMICDPLLAAKAQSGRAEEIRACIGCNQACIGHFHAGYPISCIQYPEAGRELVYGVRARASSARDVMVVGGGPAGLKAAAVAAERGHRVTLYEAGRRVGGQALLAQALPGRAEFGGLVTNLEGEAVRAGARILTGVAVDAARVAAEAPDVVLVATGARPRRPPLETTDDPVVLDVWQVLGGAEVPSGRVVVADFRCDWVGLGVADHLARMGRKVTLAVDGYMAGQRIQQYVRDTMTTSALRAGVEVLPLVRIVGADDDTVYLQHVLTGEPVLLPASALVLAQGHLPDDTLLHHLIPGARAPSFTSMEVPVPSDSGAGTPVSAPAGRGAPAGTQGPEVHGIGDVLSPRTAEEAVLDALRVATLL